MFIVEVPALKVKLVFVTKFIVEVVLLSETVLLPSVIVLVLVFEDCMDLAVKL